MAICTLTARRLKPGSYDDFRTAWGGGSDEAPEGAEKWDPVYHCRDVDDENVVISMGFFQGSLDELREAQKGADGGTDYEEMVAAVEPYVEEVLLDGAYEVVEELKPE